MKHKALSVLGAISLLIVSCQMIDWTIARVKDRIDAYTDSRIMLAIREERQYVYEDLHKLYPYRVQYTRHGSPYVTERE